MKKYLFIIVLLALTSRLLPFSIGVENRSSGKINVFTCKEGDCPRTNRADSKTGIDVLTPGRSKNPDGSENIHETCSPQGQGSACVYYNMDDGRALFIQPATEGMPGYGQLYFLTKENINIFNNAPGNIDSNGNLVDGDGFYFQYTDDFFNDDGYVYFFVGQTSPSGDGHYNIDPAENKIIYPVKNNGTGESKAKANLLQYAPQWYLGKVTSEDMLGFKKYDSTYYKLTLGGDKSYGYITNFHGNLNMGHEGYYPTSAFIWDYLGQYNNLNFPTNYELSDSGGSYTWNLPYVAVK